MIITILFTYKVRCLNATKYNENLSNQVKLFGFKNFISVHLILRILLFIMK